MRVLQRKLVRDLLGSKGTLLTVVAIIAVGTGLFMGIGSAQRILEASQDAYYRQYQFADFWVSVKKAPLTAVDRVARLPGVAAIQARVVFDVIVDLPDEPRPIMGRLISTPARNFDQAINGICLIRGSGFSDERNEEVILSEPFAQAHSLEIGDRIHLILNRKRESFVIVGTAISPEYVYMVRGQGDIIPDPQHFGILYVKDDYARQVLDFKDACNQISGHLSPGGEHDVDLLLERIDRLLDPYGVLATTPRRLQASHYFLSSEIRGLAVSAIVSPSIFLVVAALVLNIQMTRFAERQRTIIGTLKALGYSDHRLLLHFLAFGIVVGLIGGLVGDLLGVGLAIGMVHMYKGFFQFPTFVYRIYPDLLLTGLGISVFFAVAGSARGAWAVLKLQPAEAMRQKPPQSGRAIFLERFAWLWRKLSFRTQMTLRGMARHRTRTLTGVLASALGMAIIFTSLVLYDSTFFLVDFQFEQVAHSDVDIGMRDEKSVAALFEGRALPAVYYAEPLLGLTCDLRNGRHSRRVAISGLSAGHRLTTPVQSDFSPIQLPPDGLVLSKKLAEILHVGAGDQLELTPVRGNRQTRRVRVASIAQTFLGLECYADLRYLSRIVGEGVAVNAVQLAVNEADKEELYRAIKRLPNAQSLAVRADSKANIEATLVESMVFSLGLLIVFAGIIALGTMLNISLVEIADRLRDISTFRVLGYQPAEVAGIFLRQNLVIFMLGMLLAIPIGYGMVVGTAIAYDTELFRMPILIRPVIVLLTVLTAFVFVLLAQWFAYRQIRKLDWLEGVKVKE